MKHGRQITLTPDARGRTTLPRDVLVHLGVGRGGKIELELLPHHEILLRSIEPSGTIEAFIGLLAGESKRIATIEEMNAAAAEGWAGQVK